MMNVQKRIGQGLNVLQYYTARDWKFRNDNLVNLSCEMNDVDKEKFFCDTKPMLPEDYMRNYVLGVRKFMLKETPESLPKSRRLLKR